MMIVWVALACTQPPDPRPDDEGTTGTDTADAGDTETSPTGDTAPTGDTDPPLDCSVRPEVEFVRHHDYLHSSEDFTFDDEGYLWGVEIANGALIRTRLDGEPEVMRPNVSTWGRGVRFLLDRDLVLAEPVTGSLFRFDRETMGQTVLTSGYHEPNGVAIGTDGFVYLTQANGRVMRIDPNTGAQSLLFDTPVSTDGITFAPDYERLYWNSESGEIFTMVIDADGAEVEAPSVLTTILGFLDGMAADACGNLYVVEMAGAIVRVTPDGTQERLIELASPDLAAANFGSGIGGWEADHLYIMSLSMGMYEFDVGIPGKREPHLPQ